MAQTKFELPVTIPAADQKQAFQVKESLNFMVQKLGAKGILKLQEIYENDLVTRKLVNKKLGI